MLLCRFLFFTSGRNSFSWLVFLQLKAKTELLLSAEAAKAAQKANLENNLETAQHALQDKQQVSLLFVPQLLNLLQFNLCGNVVIPL